MDDEKIGLMTEAFINALRRHPKEPALAIYVAPKGSVPSGGRECSEEDIGKALRYIIANRLWQ